MLLPVIGEPEPSAMGSGGVPRENTCRICHWCFECYRNAACKVEEEKEQHCQEESHYFLGETKQQNQLTLSLTLRIFQ